ncbi:MAG: hypothetical protein AAFV53_21700 [Myxococcota bacterium]
MMETIVGAGRIGVALSEMGEAHLVRRGQPLPEATGPIYVCTRNDDLIGVIENTPPARRADLVFVQNGMIETFLDTHGMAENTQGLLYFAVSSVGATPVDGGQTTLWGRWAPVFAERLRRGGIQCIVQPDRDAYRRVMVEKFLWIAVFGLLSQRHQATVGAVVKDHRPDVDDLTAELTEVCERALGLTMPTDLADRLCAYSMSIASYQGAVKEFPWRNGWLLAQERTPLHVAWLSALGINR